MTTQVNVTSTTGGQQLVDRAKTQQGASRFAFQEKQASVADAKKVQRQNAARTGASSSQDVDADGKSIQSVDGYRPLAIKDDLAANRFGQALLAGAQSSYQAPDQFLAFPRYQVNTMAASGGYPNYVTPPPSAQPGQTIQILYEPDWQGQDFSEAYVPPGSACVEIDAGVFLCHSSSSYSWEKNIDFILPAGGKNFVVLLKYTNLATGHRSVAINDAFTLYEDRFLTSSVSKALLVSPDKVKEIPVPSETSSYLDTHLPDLAPNTTPITDYDARNEEVLTPNFDPDLYEQSRLYGNANFTTLAFARSFGLGVYRYDGTSHNQAANYWTPSVFALLKGDLSLPSGSVTDYSQMESILDGLPLPNRYWSLDGPLLPGFNANAKTKVAIVPSAAVSNFLEPIGPGALQEKVVDVQIRASDFYFQFFSFAYAWDWGNPGYCRQQLFDLGFTAADLKP